jgi:hypothetical protein
MSIHEHLPPQARKDLKMVGWTKGLELAKLARRDGQHFDCATWLHKGRALPKEDFRREVEKELTGKEEEPSELIYFKIYKRQIPVIDQAIETAALMLGTDKSRGYCLEMICADFLAGAHMDNSNPEILLTSISRCYKFLPGEQQQIFLDNLREKASRECFAPKPFPRGWTHRRTKACASRSCVVTVGGVNPAARCRILRCTTRNSAAIRGLRGKLDQLCAVCHARPHRT